ncbi:MAG TPA: hypothetical protein DCE56_27455 [Cyanobacteria bacterium UBA8553]|nr:hypothetical protein [Cyanobacteria bacterium UBA8553]HAJ61942.1 hypothetical protein [Cyanobacteria bacterium UBA8543]
MNKDALTLLGCSGSLVLALLTVNPAQANTTPLREVEFVAPGANEVQEVNTPVTVDNLDCGCTQQDSDYSSINSSDTIGDLAIENMGCDCAGCRNMVVQRVQTGMIKLP